MLSKLRSDLHIQDPSRVAGKRRLDRVEPLPVVDADAGRVQPVGLELGDRAERRLKDDAGFGADDDRRSVVSTDAHRRDRDLRLRPQA